MRQLRPIELKFKEAPWHVSRRVAQFLDPAAVEFGDVLLSNGYEADKLLTVVPAHKLIYMAVPKAASTRIRRTLAKVDGRFMRSLKPSRRRSHRGPYGMRNMTVSAFYRLATDPRTLRFSFVRNPYARVVSCWADKFADKPLVPGDKYVDAYLAIRRHVSDDLPAGADHSLTFPAFVEFAAATALASHDAHVQAQHSMLDLPGIAFDFIGKVENFNADFARVLDHLDADDHVRREAETPLNESHHDDWPKYYTDELASRIYRAYECDFDRFGYPRDIPAVTGK
jgi:hypothetical protein